LGGGRETAGPPKSIGGRREVDIRGEPNNVNKGKEKVTMKPASSKGAANHSKKIVKFRDRDQR